jgi:hypothetical protein
MGTDTRAKNKISILIDTLYGIFGEYFNQARINFIMDLSCKQQLKSPPLHRF